jgi:hypothetical protein
VLFSRIGAATSVARGDMPTVARAAAIASTAERASASVDTRTTCIPFGTCPTTATPYWSSAATALTTVAAATAMSGAGHLGSSQCTDSSRAKTTLPSNSPVHSETRAIVLKTTFIVCFSLIRAPREGNRTGRNGFLTPG